MSSPEATGHPTNPPITIADMQRFIEMKQPHVYRDFMSLLRQYPVLQATRAFHEAVSHFLDGASAEIIDGYRGEDVHAISTTALSAGALYFRNTTTLTYAHGSIDAFLKALEGRVTHSKLSSGAMDGYQAALLFYRRLLGFSFATLQNAKRAESRETIIPGPIGPSARRRIRSCAMTPRGLRLVQR